MSPKSLNGLLNLVSTVSFDDIYLLTDIDDDFNCFLKLFEYVIEITCPLKRSNNFDAQSEHWINSDIKRAISELKNMYWFKMDSNTYACNEN